MPTLNKYASSNQKTGYFVRANVGGNHPVTLQTTGAAERIFHDNEYSDGSTIPTKLVWSMYDVGLLYTESSVSNSTPSHSFDSLSDAVTGSELTEETRRDLIQYFGDYSGPHQPQVSKLLSELRRETAAGAIETYDSSEPLRGAKEMLTKYSSNNEDQVDQMLDKIGEEAYESLLIFGQRASQIKDIELSDYSTIAYEFSPLSVPGEVIVYDLTPANNNGQHDYRIEYNHRGVSSIYVQDGSVTKVTGSSSNISSSETRQLVKELTPVEVEKSHIRSTVDAPDPSDVDIPTKAFLQGDSDLLVGVVDRVSNSDNPVVELEQGHILLDSGAKNTVYFIDRMDSKWGRVLCALTESSGPANSVADQMPLIDEESFRGIEIEEAVVKAAASYHDNHQEIVAAEVSGDRLEYATRASLDDGTAGPRCGFSVGITGQDSMILEIFADPDDETRALDYGEPGIRHRVVLTNREVNWETVVSESLEYSNAEFRDELLLHQVKILRMMKETLDLHIGAEYENLIADVVSSGYLEQGMKKTSAVWEDSHVLGEVLAESDSQPSTYEGKNVTGTVDFFNDTGGYGFIETDACEEDVFYHMEDVGGPDIIEGEEVTFNIRQAEKGPRAIDIERIR